MTKLLFILAITFTCVGQSLAQYDSKGENETSRFRPGLFWHYTGINPAKLEKVHKYDRLFFDISYNTWTGDLTPFKVKPTSIGFGTNLMFYVPLKKGNTVSLGWGFNHHWTHIRHDETFFNNLIEKSTEYSISPVESRSSLNFHQISIPLEIRFHKESWKHAKLHVGGKVGYLFGMNEKERLDNPNGKTIIQSYNFQDVNHLQYSAHIRLGIRNYALFGEYNFSKLFSNSKSTQLNVLRMGISISLF
jgi:hypothetical protein